MIYLLVGLVIFMCLKMIVDAIRLVCLVRMDGTLWATVVVIIVALASIVALVRTLM